MKPIMSLIYELNSLCEMYDLQIDDSVQKQRIRQILSEFVKQGYKVVRPKFEPTSEEYKRLSDNGKLLCKHLLLVHRKKQEAIDSSHFEFAAYLRDWECDIKRTIITEFSTAITKRIFVLKSDETKEIIYNNSNGKLKEIFNLT
jgi:hypothetical protein